MNDNIYYIYRHIRLDTNQVFYIGMGKYQKKWTYQRALTTKNRNIYWKRIVALNNNSWKTDIMMDNLTKEEACEKEIEFIKLYGRNDLKKGTLCNLRDGGEGGHNLSEEARERIRQSKIGNKNHQYGKSRSKEWKDYMSDLMKGEGNPNYGKTMPNWHREINRKAQLGRKYSQEEIEKRCKKVQKKVIDISTGIIYDSVKDTAKAFNKSESTISIYIKYNKHNLQFYNK